jgi:hypothetical protein
MVGCRAVAANRGRRMPGGQLRAIAAWDMVGMRGKSHLVVIAGLVLLPAAARAEMLFYFRNGTGSAVAVEVFSQDRQEVWPGGGQVWLFETGQKKTVPIACTPGEHICYGAWVNGNEKMSWGVGPDGAYACKNCCLICLTRGIETIDLPPGE